MKFNILEIQKNEGAVLNFDDVSIPLAAFERNGELFSFPVPVVLSGNFTNIGSGTVRLRAQGEYTLRLRCARCLKEFDRKFPLRIEEMLKSEDAVHGMYDISESVFDTVLLSMDLRYLCKPDCKGLCSKCGADLNEEECGCARVEIDPRLSILNQLLEED